MGPLLVLVSPCFRENVVVTCKIGSFLCSSEKRRPNCFLFWKSFFKMALIWKKGLFWPTFHIFCYQGKLQKSLQHSLLTHIHTCILLTLLTFLPYQFWKKKIRIYQVWSLFGRFLVMILVLAILEQSINNNMVSNI